MWQPVLEFHFEALSENTIDAIVMASAASRGDVVYSSDFDDLSRLAAYFPEVRALGV